MFEPLLVWSDEESCDVQMVKLLSWSNDLIPVNTFLEVTDSQTKITWILTIKEPNRNIDLGGLDRKDPRTAEAMRRFSKGKLEDLLLGDSVRLYVAEVIGMIVDGQPKAVDVRPKERLMATEATLSNVLTSLRLPENYCDNKIGVVNQTDIPVSINKRAFDHNTIIAGTIGSGKSESLGRIIYAANQMDYCVFVYDHKPDYQDLTVPNDFGDFPRGFSNETVRYWTLGSDPKEGESAISVPMSEVDIDFLLESCLFPGAADELQRAVFGKLLSVFKEAQKGGYWTCADFISWFNNKVIEVNSKGAKGLTDYGKAIFQGASPNAKTLETAYKIPTRIPSWIDRKEKAAGNLLFANSSFDNFLANPEVFEAGKINVINVTQASSGEYALFAVTLLKAQLRGRANKTIEPWVLNIIDEAQDIFNGSDSLRKIAIPAFAEITRKGRSKHVGSVFAVQAFTEVPDQIVQYCNSRIIMRHGSKEMAKSAMDGDSFAATQTTSFEAGDAYVRIFGCPTYVRAKMTPSPFKITKEDAPEDYAR